MAWIRQIEPDQAKGELKDVYEKVAGARGKIANIIKIHSLSPKAMRAHMDLYMAIMFDRTARSSELNREQREMIAVVVSVANGCDYCVEHHAAALNHYWKNNTKLQAFIEDHRSTELSESMAAILDHAVIMTHSPHSAVESHIIRLRDAGLSDEAILNINLIIAYFNFVNRIALGLGVEFNREEIAGYQYE